MATLFMATVIGWYLVIVSLFLMFRTEYVKSIIVDLVAQRGLLFIVALLTVIMGLMMVTVHNIWVLEWPLVITLFSWLVLLGGLARLFCLDHLAEMSQSFLNHPIRLKISGLIYLLIGLFLLFHVYAIYFYL